MRKQATESKNGQMTIVDYSQIKTYRRSIKIRNMLGDGGA